VSLLLLANANLSSIAELGASPPPTLVPTTGLQDNICAKLSHKAAVRRDNGGDHRYYLGLVRDLRARKIAPTAHTTARPLFTFLVSRLEMSKNDDFSSRRGGGSCLGGCASS
jgi:hypothetical protein